MQHAGQSVGLSKQGFVKMSVEGGGGKVQQGESHDDRRDVRLA
jgi:hypothetical protein